MLSYARQNTREYLIAGQARFVQADAADFSLDARYGFIVSTFDAMNHLPDEESLRSCFKCVSRVLELAGTFIFDLNTAQGLRQWNGMAVDDADPDALIINRGFIVGENHRAWTAITGFLKEDDGRFTRFDEVAYNTIFKLSVVESLLRESGFKQVHFAKGSDLWTHLDDPESESRIFVVASQT
jgi:SAM-dependent methyltransferase